MQRFMLLIVLLLLSASLYAQGPIQNPANGHWYQAVAFAGNWDQANAQAQSMTLNSIAGHLATITSSAENDFIGSQLPTACSDAYWIGGYQDHNAPDYSEPAGGWKWVTGETWNFTLWSAGEPNNQSGIEDFLLYRGFTDCSWNDGRTNDFSFRGFVVEFESAPSPQYTICLLYDATRPVKSGATVPIKIQLCDGTGQNVSSINIILHATLLTQTSSSTTGPVQDSGNANPDNDFRFDPTLGGSGGYIFNLSTKGLSTGMYNLSLTVTGDSVTYTAPFQVK